MRPGIESETPLEAGTPEPRRVIEYQDPVEGFSGWLVYDRTDCRLAVGGCRVQSGLTVQTLAGLADRMTLKQLVLGVNVDGAKCGIDYNPRSAGKDAALRRFLRFLSEELHTRFSMGSDMGTQWDQLEELARLESIPSIKYAIKGAQELSEDEFFARMRVLHEPLAATDGLGGALGVSTLSERRAGHALAEAAVAAAKCAGLSQPLSCALQGFGNLGRAAAYSLLEAGVRITAVADEFGCVVDPGGLDVARMLRGPHLAPVSALADGAVADPPESLFEQQADVLILAGCEDAMSPEQARRSRVPVVVVGANCGLSRAAEALLHGRGVFTVPDFVGGIGGSASMEALFGPPRTPSPQQVLDGISGMMHRILEAMVQISAAQHLPLRAAAMRMADKPAHPDERPYGSSPYLMAGPEVAR